MTPPPPPRGGRRGGYYGGGGCLGTFIAMIAIIAVVIATGFSSAAKAVNSVIGNSSKTVTREKLSNSSAFNSDCIVDELGWFENTSSAGKSLKTFYDKTGVQPYVVLLAYDDSLKSDAAKNNYANKYFNENIADEDAFLMIYFAEEDADEEVGYMSYVCGNNALAVMDSDAVEVFWNNIDEYWFSSMTTDDMFEKVFTETANTIMSKSSSGFKISSTVWKILLMVVVVVAAVVLVRFFKRREEADLDSSTGNKDKVPNMLN
jgi:hypothetical protein